MVWGVFFLELMLIILGVILTLLFFLHIKSAADILCRIIGGFAVLFVYNALAVKFSLPVVGINFLSAVISGLLGLPGGGLIVCCAAFL